MSPGAPSRTWGENHTSEGWRTIPVERTAGCRILAGRRFRSGDEAVLFGFPSTAVAADSSSLPRARGFQIEIVREQIPGGRACLVCSGPATGGKPHDVRQDGE